MEWFCPKDPSLISQAEVVSHISKALKTQVLIYIHLAHILPIFLLLPPASREIDFTLHGMLQYFQFK